MPSIVFVDASSGNSKEVDLADVNSVEDVATNVKEVMQQSNRCGYDYETEGALGDYPEE